MALVSYQLRLPASVPKETSALEVETIHLNSSCPTSNRRSSREVPLGTSNRKITYAKRSIPLTIFYYSGTKQNSSNSGLQENKRIHTMPSLQDGRCSGAKGTDRRERLITKIDLKDAYVVVPIHKESRQFLSFRHHGEIFQYRSLPFGLSVAPRVFSKLMRFALTPLREQGIRIVYYLDDIQ